MRIVEDVHVVLDEDTMTLKMSSPVKDPRKRTRKEIEDIHQEDHYEWISRQLKQILDSGRGTLANSGHPMRAPGAGILPLIDLDDEPMAILHVRGSNRGAVWPAKAPINHPFCWKEFAGLCDEEDMAPDSIAKMELREELTLYAFGHILKQVPVADGGGQFFCVVDIREDDRDRVRIEWGIPVERQIPSSIVSYDPSTNALEISFVADLRPSVKPTGMMSLAGPEDGYPPFLEDLVLVSEGVLKEAKVGDELKVKHLLSVHGSTNLKDSEDKTTRMFYNPAPTLGPLVLFLNELYNPRKALEAALDQVQARRGS